jgi:hypothetical protein
MIKRSDQKVNESEVGLQSPDINENIKQITRKSRKVENPKKSRDPKIQLRSNSGF